MASVLNTRFSESDILFLLDTVNPELLSKIDTIKGDADIIEEMMEHEVRRLFRRIMLMNEEAVMSGISPRFLFEVLLRTVMRDLESQAYTVERGSTLKIPVFDTAEVFRFLNTKFVLQYLADMLTSFTRIKSFTIPVRVRKGVWRKIRFNDMDIDSLLGFCQAVDEQYRFSYYKRIADLCLFIVGMFPEFVNLDYRYPSSHEPRPSLFGRLRRSTEDYEEEGRRFYKLAGEHKTATVLDLSAVLYKFHDKFHLAKKPLNYISEYLLNFRKGRLFPALSSD